MSPEDTLAVSMLVILAFAAGALMTILISMIRNAGKRDELEELMREEDDEEPTGETTSAKGSKDKDRKDWEKDGDWWKGTL